MRILRGGGKVVPGTARLPGEIRYRMSLAIVRCRLECFSMTTCVVVYAYVQRATPEDGVPSSSSSKEEENSEDVWWRSTGVCVYDILQLRSRNTFRRS